MKAYKVPMSYNEIDAAGLHAVLDRYKGVSHQKIIVDFEKKLKSLSDAKHAVALNSGTAALHLALKLLNTGPGDLVLVSTFTYVASVSPILYCGAEPVFIDSERETWNMDPQLLEDALKDLESLNKRPKAIIVVHAYGMPAKMMEIMAIAEKWGVPVIEDAAEAFGATINNQWAGTFGQMGIYSFNNNKSVTTFGGGALITKNHEWAEKARKWAAHARENKPYYEHIELGYNYAMSPLSAAYGLMEADAWKTKIEARRELFSNYRVSLSDHVTSQNELQGAKSSRWLSTFRLKNKQNITQLIDNQEFEIRKVWNPMHRQGVFREAKSWLNGTSDDLFESAVCLPSGEINSKDFQQMCAWLQNML
ncbi:MAG: DegT/DnrJ/EryC1/StrS family aminotransferase [Cyclobacteriaceae bacterium]